VARELGRRNGSEGSLRFMALALVACPFERLPQLEEVPGDVRAIELERKPLETALGRDHCPTLVPERARPLGARFDVFQRQRDSTRRHGGNLTAARRVAISVHAEPSYVLFRNRQTAATAISVITTSFATHHWQTASMRTSCA
jgi:hypothetical protein